ncbi:MAG: hypothetical protein MR828_13470 [Clostridiales bacterium]|nr:hypothetical protein [Clostridiales bacterium]
MIAIASPFPLIAEVGAFLTEEEKVCAGYCGNKYGSDSGMYRHLFSSADALRCGDEIKMIPANKNAGIISLLS